MEKNEVIVSKTNLKGHITYANDVFLKFAELSDEETIGKPHSVIRNASMPRCIFKLLWQRLEAGEEVFAYVKNTSASGGYYWVLAHVTPSISNDGQVTGYHSSRRKPARTAIEKIEPLYAQLLEEEKRHNSRKDGMNAAFDLLQHILDEKGVEYDEFVLSL